MSFENKIEGFRILTGHEKDDFEYYGDVLALSTMRSYLEKQIFFTNFLEEFELIKKIGQGKYAKVTFIFVPNFKKKNI